MNLIVQNVKDAWNGVVDVSAKIKGEIFLVGCLAYVMKIRWKDLRDHLRNYG